MNPLATREQAEAERAGLRIVELPEVRAAREEIRRKMLKDPVAQTPIGLAGLDRALDQWMLQATMREVNSDPYRPKVIWNIDNAPRTWFGHTYSGSTLAGYSPDNLAREILIHGDSVYEVDGHFNTPSAGSFNFITEIYNEDGSRGSHVASINLATMDASTDGRFRVTVGAEPREEQNHIPINPGIRQWLITRDTLSDWREKPASLSIRRVSGPPAPPIRTEAEIVRDLIKRLPTFMNFWTHFKDTHFGFPEYNILAGPNGRSGSWGYLAAGRFKLKGDEAIVFVTQDANSAYTGAQALDPWLIAPDPIFHTSCLNNSQVKPNPDGTCTYVLSMVDPEVHNWINTVGMDDGWFQLRWQIVPENQIPQVLSMKLVKLDELDKALPPGTPKVSLFERRAQIQERVDTYHLRSAEGDVS